MGSPLGTALPPPPSSDVQPHTAGLAARCLSSWPLRASPLVRWRSTLHVLPRRLAYPRTPVPPPPCGSPCFHCRIWPVRCIPPSALVFASLCCRFAAAACVPCPTSASPCLRAAFAMPSVAPLLRAFGLTRASLCVCSGVPQNSVCLRVCVCVCVFVCV